MIRHYSVINMFRNDPFNYFAATDRVGQYFNYAFDGSVHEIFGALLNGAALVLFEKETITELNRLADTILSRCITTFHVTPLRL